MITNTMLLGATAVTCLMIGLIFVRFWKTTRDPFFFLFAASFFIEGASRVGLAMWPHASEHEPVFYCIRLIVFLILIYAIVDKNLRSERFKKIKAP